MSRAAAPSSDDNSRWARANTGAPSPFTRPSGLTRSKSVGAINKSAPSYRDWITVPAAREVVARKRSESTGNQPSGLPPPPLAKDVQHLREALEAPRIERAKTPVKSTAVGGVGNGRESSSNGGTGGGGGSGDVHTNTFTSIAAKVRPKLASLTNLRRSKSHQISKSASAAPSTHAHAQIPFIYEEPNEPVPPPPTPFARLVPREPVVRRSKSLYNINVNSFRPAPSKPNTLPPPLKAFGGHKREITPSDRTTPHSAVEKYDENPGAQPPPRTSPIRTVNRRTTVYAPAPSVPPSSQKSSKHLLKPSLSLTLPNGVSIVHEPLLLSPILRSAPSLLTTPSLLTPPLSSRPPPRAHLPESPNDFTFGFDIKPEVCDAPPFSPRPPSAFSIASYYYTTTDANADYRDVITRYIELDDMESVRSLEIRNNGGWAAPSSQLTVPQVGPSGSLKSPAQLPQLDRGSVLPTPEPIGDGKFPPLPPPPKHNKKLPAILTPRDKAEEYADESTQVLRSQRSLPYHSHPTPTTPDTPPLMTPKGNIALPTLAPWRTEEDIPYLLNQEVSILAKRPSLKLKNKRSLRRPATSGGTVN